MDAYVQLIVHEYMSVPLWFLIEQDFPDFMQSEPKSLKWENFTPEEEIALEQRLQGNTNFCKRLCNEAK